MLNQQMNIEIRKEEENDYSDVYDLNKMAFGQDNESKLIDLLRNSSAFIPDLSLVATIDLKIVGYILFSKIKVKDNSGTLHDSLAVAPMAVHPNLQRLGIGSALVRYGLEKAKAMGHRSVIVLGHEHYYPRFGFIPTINWNIKAPFEVPANVLMGLELVNDALRGVSGTIQYPKEFEAAD